MADEEKKQMEAGEEFLEYDEILEEYRRRQMIEHLTGPMISVVLHVAVIIVLAILMAGDVQQQTAAVEFQTQEMEIKPIDPETQEELDELDEQFRDDPVPTVQQPDMQPQEVQTDVSSDFEDAMADTEMDVEVSTVLARPSPSRLTMGGIWASRKGDARQRALTRHGGNRLTEAAVRKALAWLKREQKPDGSWPGNEAHTGLALLTFLAHGETQDSEEYGTTVVKAIQWLTNKMMDVNHRNRRHHAYINGIATYALAEAYGLTQLPLIKPAMEKGLRFIVNGQQNGGGFNYGYNKGDRWDLSVGGWQLQAMKAGMAAGAEVEGLEEAAEKGVNWVKNTTYKNAQFQYSSGRTFPASTGAGILCLQLLGEGKSTQAKAAVEKIAENYRHDYENPPRSGHYTWYYQTQAMFHAGRRFFRPWNESFAPMLVANQEEDGRWKAMAESRGDVYSTSLCALSLQVYYRYLPTYQASATDGAEKKTESALDFDDDDLDLDLE